MELSRLLLCILRADRKIADSPLLARVAPLWHNFGGWARGGLPSLVEQMPPPMGIWPIVAVAAAVASSFKSYQKEKGDNTQQPPNPHPPNLCENLQSPTTTSAPKIRSWGRAWQAAWQYFQYEAFCTVRTLRSEEFRRTQKGKIGATVPLLVGMRCWRLATVAVVVREQTNVCGQEGKRAS